MSNTQPLALRSAGRRTHTIRKGQICPCCMSLRPRSGEAQRVRRTQRRIERQTWRAEVA